MLCKCRRMKEFLIFLGFVGVVYYFTGCTEEAYLNEKVAVNEVEFEPESNNIKSEYKNRLQHVKTTCKGREIKDQNYTVEDPGKYFFNIVDDNHRIILCEVPLVACANWKRVMLVLSGKLNVTSVDELRSANVHGTGLGGKYLRRLSTYSKEEIRYRLKYYFKFLFVRNPLERLLSAYLKKFTIPEMTSFQLKFGRTIARLFRNNPNPESLTRGHDVTFPEFLKYVLNAEQIEHGKVDRHWTSYMNLCNPCSIDYDFIGKYETFSRDVKHVLSMAKIDKIVSFPKTTHWKQTPQTSNLLSEHFTAVSKEDSTNICKKFEYDFMMFNYTCQP